MSIFTTEKATGLRICSTCRSFSFLDGHHSYHEHITPLLRDLHWLPVRERIEFKLAMLVFRCLHGTAPPWRTSCVVSRTSTQEDGCVLRQRLLS